MTEAPASLRADKYLHHVRVFKTRSLAAQACSKGNVSIRGTTIKPSRDVRIGDVLEVQRGDLHLTLRILGLPAARISAPAVPLHCEDLTPPEVREKAREARKERALISPPTPHETASKPDKKQMRQLRAWMGLE